MTLSVNHDDICGAVEESGFREGLRRAGARFQTRNVRGGVEYRAVFPRVGAAPIVVSHIEPVQEAVVGGRIGRKIKKKLKAAAKKVAKSKVFKAVTKVAAKLGKVLPGPIGMALKAGSKVMNVAVKAAAKGKAGKAVAALAAPKGGVVVRARSGKRYRVTPA